MATKVVELTPDMATDEVVSALKQYDLRGQCSRVLSHYAGPDFPGCVATVVLVRVGGDPDKIAAALGESLGGSADVLAGKFSVSVFRPRSDGNSD